MIIRKEHWIFKTEDNGKTFALEYKVPYKADDPNHGLPQSFFYADNLIQFEVDGDKIEWTPVMGPAPCWDASLASFNTEAEMIAAWLKWISETY